MRILFMIGLLLSLSVTFSSAQTDSSMQTGGGQANDAKDSIEQLREQVVTSEAQVNELVNQLRGQRSETVPAENAEAATGQLRAATRSLFDLQTKLHYRELAEAEASIAASRQRLDERMAQADEIVARRVKSLLEVPPQFSSPQAAVEAMERFAQTKDWDRYVEMLADEEAQRIAGMIMEMVSMMENYQEMGDGKLPDGSNELASVAQLIYRSMRRDPPAEALAAMERLSNILTQFIYEIGAMSGDGKPLRRPDLSETEHSELLRASSGMLSDPRAFIVAALKTLKGLCPDRENIVASNWIFEVDQNEATATQSAKPIEQTRLGTSLVALRMDNGRWKIVKFEPDEEVMQKLRGPFVIGKSQVPNAEPATSPIQNERPPFPSHPYYTLNGPTDFVSPVRKPGQPRLILGQWQVKLYTADDFGIANGRLLDPEQELVALEETIPREDLLAGPWILEIAEESLSLQHATARLPVLTLDISDIDDDSFQVDLTKQGRRDPLAAFGPDLTKTMVRGRYRIDGNSLRLCVDEVSDERDQARLSPNADIYLECERVKEPTGSTKKPVATTEASDAESLPEWNDFLELLPQSGTTLVVFDDGTENAKKMQVIARSVAETASIQLLELPQTKWRRVIAPPAVHFVLMKDRGVVATRTGLLTEKRLQDFVALADDWLTPQMTGVNESSLVRIDCFINPGRDNVGSQYGSGYPLTTTVVAVDEDRALLLGPASIAGYIEKGYACVALTPDASGKRMQVPLDVVHIGPVPLQGRSIDQDESKVKITVTNNRGMSMDVPIGNLAYPVFATESLDAYDTGIAVYLIRGAYGLKPVRMSEAKYVAKIDDRVLSVGFRREHHVPPLHNVKSPLEWQSQIAKGIDDAIYGGNLNGPHLMTVLCPKRPAPTGVTFTDDGRMIGQYALGSPSEDDMTHTVHQPYTLHSVLQAALPKIDADGLRSSLKQQLE